MCRNTTVAEPPILWRLMFITCGTLGTPETLACMEHLEHMECEARKPLACKPLECICMEHMARIKHLERMAHMKH